MNNTPRVPVLKKFQGTFADGTQYDTSEKKYKLVNMDRPRKIDTSLPSWAQDHHGMNSRDSYNALVAVVNSGSHTDANGRVKKDLVDACLSGGNRVMAQQAVFSATDSELVFRRDTAHNTLTADRVGKRPALEVHLTDNYNLTPRKMQKLTAAVEAASKQTDDREIEEDLVQVGNFVLNTMGDMYPGLMNKYPRESLKTKKTIQIASLPYEYNYYAEGDDSDAD